MKPETFAAFVSSVLYEKRCVISMRVGADVHLCLLRDRKSRLLRMSTSGFCLQKVSRSRVIPLVPPPARQRSAALPSRTTDSSLVTFRCAHSLRRFGPYYCEPVIAGLKEDGKPFITGMDLIGAMCASFWVAARACLLLAALLSQWRLLRGKLHRSGRRLKAGA